MYNNANVCFNIVNKGMGDVDLFILLILSVAAATFYSIVLNKADIKKNGSVFLQNLLCSVVWLVILFALNGGKINITQNVLLWGAIYGVTQALFILFKTKAMNEGAVSLTTLVGNCSLLISVFACFVIWNEPISFADICGLLVLVFGIMLVTYKKQTATYSKKWIVSVIFFLIFGAAVGLVFKAFSKSNTGSAGDMMIVSSVVMIISYSVVCLLNGDIKNKLPALVKTKNVKFLLMSLVCGVLSCAYNRINIYLSGEMDGIVFFPCFNGGVVVLSTVLGVLLLREKLGARQIVGIILGICGICVIGIF